MTIDYKRPTQQLEDGLAFARGEIERLRGSDYADQLRGVVAAIEWALGREAVSPAGRTVQLPERHAQWNEAQWAGEIETGVRAIPQGMNKHYARGVGSALLVDFGAYRHLAVVTAGPPPKV